ncbi:hypothetical protein [Noviherbaspirillum humi]|uniref:hypothetical protein n=1 Tax=Noviherbaspirillum humi TaxID=1688639 RepID=UPI001160B72A|nr:hypothetical protein [Noviherbaspirillum humi]
MRRRDLHKRLGILEVKAGSIRSETTQAMDDAIDVLISLLPHIPGISHRAQTHPAGYVEVEDVPAVSSFDRINELSKRVISKSLTGDDFLILASLNQLAMVPMNYLRYSSSEFVVYFAKILEDMDNRY